MNIHLLRLSAIGLVATLLGMACASEPTPPPVDLMATAVAEAAHALLTQTAAAASPTPLPTATPTPTETPTSTPVIAATSSERPHLPVLIAFAGCWFGPGPSYVLDSNISIGKRVEILGNGSVPGWYIIRNPYFHNPCWVEAVNLKIDERMDTSVYPVMTPGAP